MTNVKFDRPSYVSRLAPEAAGNCPSCGQSVAGSRMIILAMIPGARWRWLLICRHCNDVWYTLFGGTDPDSPAQRSLWQWGERWGDGDILGGQLAVSISTKG